MLTYKKLIIVALFGILTGPITANETYEVVKVWPEVPHGWHFYSPRGVAVDKTGNVYIADSGNHCIKKFDSNGRFLLQWGLPGEDRDRFRGLFNIEVDDSGTVYVVDSDRTSMPRQSRIQKFTAYGKFIELFERKGPDVEKFEFIVDLAVSPEGQIFMIAVEIQPEGRNARAARIEKYTPDGELLMHWGKLGQADGEFVQPFSIAINKKGDVYVTDRRKAGVQKFDSDGKFIAKWEGWGETDGLFNLPTGIAFDKQDNMYVLDRYSIQKFNPDGEFLARWKVQREGQGEYHSMWHIAADPSGNIYATDFSVHKVLKYDQNGKVIAEWASGLDNKGYFKSPTGIAVDTSGNVFVSDSDNWRIQKFNSEGKFQTTWGSRYWYMIGGIAANASGNLYVVGFGASEVQKFNPDGTLDTRWGNPGNKAGQFGGYFEGVVAGPDGNVYIADTDNCRIQKFTSDGKFIIEWGTRGTDEGQLTFPDFIGVDRYGNLYVRDALTPKKHRLQKFDSNGSFLMKLEIPESVKAVDPSGNIYCVSDGVVEKYDSKGHLDTKFGKEGGLGELLGEASAICIDKSGYLYVTEADKMSIKKYDPDGKLIKEWSPETIEGMDNFPSVSHLLAVDDAGNVYASQWSGITIWKFPFQGDTVSKFQMAPPPREGRFQNPGGLTIDKSGNIYAVDSADIVWGSPSVQKFGSNGRFMAIWGGQKATETVFKCPVSVAVDMSGNTYVTDEGNHLVHKFNAEGKFLKSWGGKGTDNGRFDMPEGIAIDTYGNIYVCDRENHRIQKFDSDGRFLTKWGQEGSGDGEFHFPAAVTIDNEGNVFVADSDNNRIQKFDSDGRFLTKWGEFGEAPGQFRVPLGIAVDESGNVYVSDTRNHRIQKFAPMPSR
jgi:streptogramin lyase